jgi:transposase-like protein
LDTEVLERAVRRRFTSSYKLRIVQEAERCKGPGELGSLLRREGLYSSHVSAWRRQYREGALSGLNRKRGRKEKRSPEERRISELEKENRRLRQRLKRAETIIEVQKKASEILGIELEEPELTESDE